MGRVVLNPNEGGLGGPGISFGSGLPSYDYVVPIKVVLNLARKD